MSSDASAMTPVYGSDLTSFAIEQRLTTQWKSQWTTRCALLARIKENGQFNKGFSIKGRAAVIPVISAGPTTAAAGVADASELTADTLSVTNGFGTAEYQYTHLRGHLTLRSSEQKLASGKEGTYRGSILEGKVMQLSSSFREVIAANIEGTAPDSRTAHAGVEFIVSQSNTVGGIAQSSNSWWQGNRITVGGAISLLNFDNAIHTINTKADGTGANYAPDLAIAYYNSSLDIYGRIHALIAPSERIVNAKFQANYGFLNFNYRGIDFVMSQRISSGTCQVLSSKSWYWGGDDSPRMVEKPYLIPGTDATVRTYNMWNFLGCDSPRVNAILTGITG